MTRLVSLLSTGVALLCIGVARAADDACATASCLANGDTPCDRATGPCPPCMYTIPGGFSCYGKVGNACPYPDTLTICPDPTPIILTAAPSVTTKTPIIVPAAPVATTTPRLTTAAPKPTEAQATVDATSSSGSAGPASHAKTPAETETSASSSKETTPATNAAAPTATQSAVAGTVAPSNGTSSTSTTDRQDALATQTKTNQSSSSPGGLNIAIIVGAVVGVLVVAMFIVRRVRQRRDLPMQDMDFKTPHLGEQKDFTQAPQSTRRQNQSRYTNTNMLSERVDYSMLEPQNPPTVRTKSARPSVASSMTSSEMVSSPREFAVGTSGRSNLPQSYSEDQFGQYQTAGRTRAKSRVRGIEKSLIQNQFPELAGSYNSDVSSVMSTQSEEFDIVDPGAIRPGERRNTETLVADGRFRQFSTASLAESYVSDATTEGSEYGTSVYI